MHKLLVLLMVLVLSGCEQEKDPNIYTAKELVLAKCTYTGEYFNQVDVTYSTVGRGAQIKHETPTNYYIYDCPEGRKLSKAELKIEKAK